MKSPEPYQVPSSGPERPELRRATYKEMRDLEYMKVIVRELGRRPVPTSEAMSVLGSRTKYLGRSYEPRTNQDFLDGMKNIHLVDRQRRLGWILTPFGSAWAYLDDGQNELSLFEKAFVLRHILMVDSNNRGLWFTLMLRLLSNEAKTYDELVETFSNELKPHGVEFHGNTRHHKLLPVLGWGKTLGLVTESENAFRLSEAGHTILSLHQSFLAEGIQAFQQQTAEAILKSFRQLKLLPELPARELSPQIFEGILTEATARLRKSRRGPLELPLVRAVCFVHALERGIALSDKAFDALIT